MKNQLIKFFSLILLLLFAVTINVKANTEPRRSKHVVVQRPVAPYQQLRKTVRLRKGYIWINGHYAWSRRTKSYQWVKGHAVKQKQNKVWVYGYWRQVPGGWVYTPGFWA